MELLNQYGQFSSPESGLQFKSDVETLTIPQLIKKYSDMGCRHSDIKSALISTIAFRLSYTALSEMSS